MTVPLAIPVARRATGGGIAGSAGAASGGGSADHEAPSPFESILDYASPRPHKRDGMAATRLPAVSDLHLSADGWGVTITETLAGRDLAVIAIVFAAGALVLIAAQAAVLADSGHLVQAVVLALLFWAELAVLVVVIPNTWRRTILMAARDGVWLTFASMFRREHRHWPRERVGDLTVVPDGKPFPTAFPMQIPAELRIQITDGPRLHLFTGHALGELEPLAKVLREALGPGGDGK